MGQKVHPVGIRLGITKSWSSKWFGKKNYADLLMEDSRLRRMLSRELKHASVSAVQIERSANAVTFTISSSRPGIIIGRGGEGIEKIKKMIQKELKGKKDEVKINIEEIRHPELDAKVVALGVAEQLERRVRYRQVLRQVVGRVMGAGAKGVRVAVAGRLDGADMSRREWMAEGRLPLHTLRADIDYACVEALTTYSTIGVKVWIYRGEKFGQGQESEEAGSVIS